MRLGEKYYINNHSCFKLDYHLVLVAKCRHNVFENKELCDYFKEYLLKIFKKNKCILIEINFDKNHVHILFSSPVNINLSTFINGLKTNSSQMIRKEFKDYLLKYYWEPVLWSRSYFICSISEKNKETVIDYIKNQGIKKQN